MESCGLQCPPASGSSVPLRSARGIHGRATTGARDAAPEGPSGRFILMTLVLALLSCAVSWWAFQEVVGTLRGARHGQALRNRGRRSWPQALLASLAAVAGVVVGLHAFDALTEAEGRLLTVGLFVFMVVRLRKHE